MKSVVGERFPGKKYALAGYRGVKAKGRIRKNRSVAKHRRIQPVRAQPNVPTEHGIRITDDWYGG